MLATPGDLPTGPGWIYEVKWDGMRLLADVSDGRVDLRSRSGRDVTANFPELAGLAQLAPDVLLDGEVVLLEHGVPSFHALADRMQTPHPAPTSAPGRRPPRTTDLPPHPYVVLLSRSTWCPACSASRKCQYYDQQKKPHPRADNPRSGTFTTRLQPAG